MKTKKFALCLVGIALVVVFTGCSSKAPSGLPDIYRTATELIQQELISPSSAVFSDFDESFVSYDRSVLEDVGEGVALEYRVYKVKSFVDSQNAFGATLRANFEVEVYAYVDDYNSAKFGEQGIHKGIEDHYYRFLLKLE